MASPPRTQIIDGTAINFEVSGPPAGEGRPTLVLVHGFGATLQTWDDVLPQLEGAYPVLRLDLKGFGHSGRPDDGRYALADQAGIVAELVRRETAGPVVLVGHSYGGAVAVLACRLLGDRAAGLVLIDAASYHQRLPFFVELYRRPWIRWTIPLATPSFRSRFVLRRLFVDKGLVHEEHVERYARPMRLPGADAASARVASQIRAADFAEVTRVIGETRVPTLVIWGDRDRAVPVKFAHRLHADIAGSHLAILPACGHMPQEERPGETVRLIRQFLRRPGAPTAAP